ncbi:glycosyltransferase, partial [Campylobacter hepaticus]
MKILIIDIDITLIGGVAKVVSNLANLLSKKHQVDILSMYKQNELFFKLDKKINLYFFNQKGYKHINKNTYKKYKYNIILYLVFKFIFKHKYYCEKIKIYFQNQKIKQIISQYDIVINNNYFLFNTIKIKNVNLIQIMHGNFIYYSKDLLKKLHFFDHLVILSDKQIDKWKKYHKNIHVIPNFIPFISQKESNYKQKNILSIGRMVCNDEKGFLRLIEIWKLIHKKYQDWTLTLVGEGELKYLIQEKIKEN